ncbi:MAG: hypothetical protein RIS09_570 [Actinomycetota bacterium]|jgi:maltose 6'-phosphate phosphatase
MRLLSLNLHCRQEQAWQSNLEVLAAFISSENIDVIALQECAQDVRAVGLSQENDLVILQRFLASYDLNYVIDWVQTHIGFDTYLEGLGILSRLPILSSKSFVISATDDITDWQTRKAQIVTFDVDGAPVEVCNLHLGLVNRGLAELDTLLRLHNLDDSIVVGDFNIPSDSETYEALVARIEQPDAYHVLNGLSDPTFFEGAHGWAEDVGKRIDYVFSGKCVSIKRVFDGRDEPRISDHMGLLADFEV